MQPNKKVNGGRETSGTRERSYERIEDADLEPLAFIACNDRARLFSRRERWRALDAERVICVALHQRAAPH